MNRNKDEKYKPPARSTLHQEIVGIRQVLKTALRHGWLSHVPDISMPYKTAGKIVRRGWFSLEEYKRLYTATRNNIETAYNKRHKKNAQQLHDIVLFMANTGCIRLSVWSNDTNLKPKIKSSPLYIGLCLTEYLKRKILK